MRQHVRSHLFTGSLHGQGTFSVVEQGAVVMGGVFHSPRYALGTINIAPCTNTQWEVFKES